MHPTWNREQAVAVRLAAILTVVVATVGVAGPAAAGPATELVSVSSTGVHGDGSAVNPLAQR